MKIRDLAKKAAAGDSEAMTLLILESPEGDMGMDSDEDYAHRVVKGMDEDPYAASKDAIRDALSSFLEGRELDAAIEAVCEAIHEGGPPEEDDDFSEEGEE